MFPTTNKTRWFSYTHLSEDKQARSKIFADVAREMLTLCPNSSDQLTIALQKLVEVKDAFVRAGILSDEHEAAKNIVGTI